VGVKLCGAVLLVYLLTLPINSYDSYWTVPTALSILGHGSTAVDDYVAAAPAAAWYSVECVPPSGKAIAYRLANGCPGGHYYNVYPIGVPILALPVVLLLKIAMPKIVRLVHAPARLANSHPVLAAFLAGDLYRGYGVVELVCAAIFATITVWLMFQIASMFVERRMALILAAIFAFGTSEWSIGSRSLLQHGPTLLMLTLTLYCLLRGWIALSALPLAFSFAVRPSNFIPVALLTLYVAIHHRAQLLRFLLWSLPVAIPFFAYNLATRHQLFPGYYNPSGYDYAPVWAGFAANMISPSRGLLIFTPIVLFSIAGMVLACRRRWCFPLAGYLIAIVAAHSLLIALFYWPGHCYGPRYYTDLTSLFIFFLLPIVPELRARLPLAVAFSILAAWGIFVHGHGATSAAVHEWNMTPVNVDFAHWRVWDWSDPQFLRGLR
jgi:hypothetical protein